MYRSEIVLGAGAREKLQHKTIAIIGIGGTGCTVAQLLSRYGMTLVLIDRDIVESHNLERQVLFDNTDIDEPKVVAAAKKLRKFCQAEIAFDDLNTTNINDFLQGVDLIIDCTDNVETRLLINDFCKKNNISWIYSGAVGEIGSIAFINDETPCYRCFNQEKYGETCTQAGVLNSTVSIIGSYVVSLAIEYLTKKTYPKELLRFNINNVEIQKLKITKNKDCPACNGNYEYLNGEKTKQIMSLCGDNKYAISIGKEIDLSELHKTLKGKLSKTCLITPDFLIFPYGRVIVTATSKEEAKKKYDEFIGLH